MRFKSILQKLICFVLLTGFISCNANSDLPSVKELDQICDENSEKLYQWDLESYKSEVNIMNNKDLEIKQNRLVRFEHKGKDFQIFPFFRKGKRISPIPFIHFLILPKNVPISQLKQVEFEELIQISPNRAYYVLE